MKKFWLVYCPRYSVMYRMPNRIEAACEADRLARKEPGKTFVVLEAVASYQVTPSEVVVKLLDS